MESGPVIEAASSPDGSLSSPPRSPHSPDAHSSTDNGNSSTNNSTIRVLGGALSHPQPQPQASASHSPATAAKNNNAAASTSTTTTTGRKKPGPKPKPREPAANANGDEKPKRTRKPRDPSAPPQPRKKRQSKAEAAAAAATAAAAAAAAAAAPVPTPVVEESKPPPEPAQTAQQASPAPQPSRQSKLSDLVSVIQPEKPAQSPAPKPTNPEPIHNPTLSHITVVPSTPRPASSGQLYDPIRSAFESKPHNATPVPPVSPPLNRASASPSITSLIDPPSASNSSYPQAARFQAPVSVTSAPVSPAAVAPRPNTILPQAEQQPLYRPAATAGTTPMEIDTDIEPVVKAPIPMSKTDSTGAGTSSAAATPPVKPQRQKEAPPPLPTGSGLLSGTPFGPAVSAPNGAPEPQGVNIWLTFPLKGQNNVTINFAREVEKKYGFAALHPRIAARRERQRQITAAGAALEKAAGVGSADDMSVDLSEPESNVEMGGVDDEASAGNGLKRKRRKKIEDYDKEDDFIDDTELAWEQQALMAKDGFFVYSGPLVTEGENPAVERADGTVRRGRGRGGRARGETSGRGRGRGGGGGGPGSRGGGGPGSRGGTTVRKPRVTKADRAMMEQEKHEREKMAATLASKQPLAAYAGTGAMS